MSNDRWPPVSVCISERRFRLSHDDSQINRRKLENALLQIRVESCEGSERIARGNNFSKCREPNRIHKLIAIERGDGNRLLGLPRPTLGRAGVSVVTKQ